MNTIRRHLIALVCMISLLGTDKIMAQTSVQTGTFVNNSQTITLQLKQEGNEYHGVMTTYGANFALRGNVKGNQMSGTIYATDGPANFTASSNQNAWVIQAFGYTETFYMTSPEHNLAGVDLTPYMQQVSQGGGAPQGQDYDYGYSQHARGHASEEMNAHPNQATPSKNPYPILNDPELRNMIAGCQVVIYNRTSYISDNVASSLTYVNYCPDGSFYITYEGSYNVDGNYGDNAQGASHGRNSGKWELVSYQGQPAVFLAFNNGTTNLYAVNKQLIRQGRWRNGNTQYAIQRGGARCR